MIVAREFAFDSAHQLVGYDGPCGRVHGHRWRLIASFEGPVDLRTQMVVDFNEIDNLIQPIVKELDHVDLNEVLNTLLPTAEHILVHLTVQIRDRGTELGFWSSNPHIKLHKLELYESPRNHAEILSYEI